jgi:excisionase family DNA binding protein
MQTNTPNPKLAYSIKEACAATSIGRSSLYAMIGNGTITTRKVGKRTLIPADSLERLVSGGAKS